MAEQVKVEIIATGNELLLGDVLDTNTNWLCKRITGAGGLVTRAVMVRDEVEAIAAAIRSALDRRPQLIITTGGLGPTGDDITLQAVAEATGCPLRLHREALALVKTRYQELAKKGHVGNSALTEARKKMAYLPRGARPVPNPVGSAPAVILEVDGSILVSLPGVPEELSQALRAWGEDPHSPLFRWRWEGGSRGEDREGTGTAQDASRRSWD